MPVIFQRKRILISDFEDDDAFKRFLKYITVSKLDMYFNEQSSWAAGYETKYDGMPVMAIPRRFNTEVLSSVISEDEEVIKDMSDIITPSKRIIKNHAEPRNDIQIDIMSFLEGKGKFEKLAKKPRKALFADTGIGKTFLTLKYISKLGYLSLINVPDDKAVMTWKQEIAKFTDILPEEIGLLAGKESFKKLIKNKDKYKIIIASSKTFSAAFIAKEYDRVQNFFEEMGIGLLVHDEVHLNLFVVFYLEMIASTKKTLYLTATPNRRIFKEQKILESLMPSDDCIYATQKKERFLFIEGRYYSNGVKADYKGVTKPNGTDYNTYSKMIIFNQTKEKKKQFHDFFINDVLIKAVRFALKNRTSDKYKIAILAKTKLENELIFHALDKVFGKKCKIGVFNSDIKDMDERFEQTKGDIIISTDKSFAGIINISDLEIIINLYPYSSISHVQQIMGRIRDEEDKKSIFMQLSDGSVPRIKKAAYKCRSAAAEICELVEFREFNKPDTYVEEE